MKVYRDISEIAKAQKSAVTVGTFDGFHLGHQTILEKIKAIAADKKLLSTIVTFDPHPRRVLGSPNGGEVSILTTTAEKLRIFEEAAIDQVLVIPFSKEFAKISSTEFVEDILIRKLAMQDIVIGHDHHFGRNREGGFQILRELGKRWHFSVHQVAEFKKDGEVISSSLIRNLLLNREVEKAARLMGRPYSLFGIVIRGNGRGRQIGFPTANLQVDQEAKLIPGGGVYAVDVLLDNVLYKGMMNIGIRPTFDFESLTLEVHIFNFDAYIYARTLEVRFKKFIRREKKFPGIEALRAQLEEDKKACKNI